MKIIERFKLPDTRCIRDLDDPAATLLHAEIIQKKPFLRKLYVDFYKQLEKVVSNPEGRVLVELGSGAGFIKEVISNAITSDILELPNVDRVFSALEMPFEKASVDAFFMFDVLHHITDPRAFFREALRFIYKNFHHERFDSQAKWELDSREAGSLQETGPLSHGNGALPWIIFSRDRRIFENEFPSLRIIRMHNHTPLRYLLSGGLT
jgi:SAM-dependent methyltransferase